MRTIKALAVVLATLACALTFGAINASAVETAAPGREVFGRSEPTNLPPGGEGWLKLYIFNMGKGEEQPGAMLTNILPPRLKRNTKYPITIEHPGERIAECTGETTLVCKLELNDDNEKFTHAIELLTIPVVVGAGPSEKTTDQVTVAGGGQLAPTKTTVPLTISASEPSFGIANFGNWLTYADGTSATQAGSHPWEFVTAFGLNDLASYDKKPAGLAGAPAETVAGGQERNITVNLPPGIIGNAQAVPRCTRKQFDELQDPAGLNACPPDTQIGSDHASIAGSGMLPINPPIYNLVPSPGEAAEFAFYDAGVKVFIDAGVRTGTDNGITAHTDNVPQRNVTFSLVKIWGYPEDPAHDIERAGIYASGEPCGQFGEPCPVDAPSVPFLSMPTSCGAPPVFSMELHGTYENPGLTPPPMSVPMHDNEDNPVGMTGCERLLPFSPTIGIAPDTSYADTPAGLSADVKMPQGLNTEGLQTPGLKDTTVVLPEGIAINPGQATGLVACQPSQEALGTLPNGESNEGPVSCPSASKVGTVEVSTPVLANKLTGNIYILGSNPPNLQLLMTASGEGINLKLVGDVHLDENTGQLTTTFQNTPDVPFTDFKLSFSGGAQAALATPIRCGVYQTTTHFTPWSTPFIEDTLDYSLFQITAGPNGTPCSTSLPFGPSMTAGATTDQAGGYTSFTMLLQRGDDQQRIKTLSFKTPEGLLGMISRVTPCPAPQAAQGTCSSASQIGHTVVGAGPGPYPFYIPQAGAPEAPIYLTGPYGGAPFGLSIVVPLIAGPFNLGTEVVRARLDVDPHTSQVTITTDPLPVTEKGIPDDLRLIDAVIDRPEFMFNPTDCAPTSFSGTATSTEGASASLSSHFQMGSCQALKFQPNFKVATSGRTSRKNGASLTAKIVYPVGNLGFNQASSQANIQSVKVNLPKQLPSRLPTLQKACTAKQFETNPAGCPKESIVGHARAITPVLPVPLEGPAYFVSHGGEAFPNLVVVLQGDNVTVDLIGDTFINEHTNITSSTFKQVPDVPIHSFELNLPEGQYSALAANTNLCKVRGGLKMPTAFTGQNGAVIHQTTPITVTGCVKHKATKKKHKTKRRK